MCSLQNVFSIECVLYRVCSLQNVYAHVRDAMLRKCVMRCNAHMCVCQRVCVCVCVYARISSSTQAHPHVAGRMQYCRIYSSSAASTQGCCCAPRTFRMPFTIQTSTANKSLPSRSAPCKATCLGMPAPTYKCACSCPTSASRVKWRFEWCWMCACLFSWWRGCHSRPGRTTSFCPPRSMSIRTSASRGSSSACISTATSAPS